MLEVRWPDLRRREKVRVKKVYIWPALDKTATRHQAKSAKVDIWISGELGVHVMNAAKLICAANVRVLLRQVDGLTAGPHAIEREPEPLDFLEDTCKALLYDLAPARIAEIQWKTGTGDVHYPLADPLGKEGVGEAHAGTWESRMAKVKRMKEKKQKEVQEEKERVKKSEDKNKK